MKEIFHSPLLQVATRNEELSQDFRFGRNLSLDLTLKPRTRTDRVGQSLCLPIRSIMGNLEPDLTGLVSLCVSQAGHSWTELMNASVHGIGSNSNLGGSTRKKTLIASEYSKKL